MKITVLKVNVSDVQGQKGPYRAAELAYKNERGETKSFKVLSFNKPVFDIVSAASANDILEVSFQKDQKGFWQMTSASLVGKADPTQTPQSSSGGTSRGNWETPDERAQRQVYIIRQSSLSAAISLAELLKAKPTEMEVMQTAESFAQYVLNGLPKVTGDVA